MGKKFWIRRLISPFLQLFLKSSCPLCNRPASTEFCQDCQRQVWRCRKTHPGRLWRGDLPVFVWGEYGGSLKRAIAALKYENHPQLAKPLGRWLGEAWLDFVEFSLDNITVVPIPLHPHKLKARGFNQAELLAEGFCEVAGLPLFRQGLERIKETKPLFGLSAKEREQELKAALVLGQDLRRGRFSGQVLLLDDIYTTGKTTNAATKVLKQAGIQVCGVVAIATTN